MGIQEYKIADYVKALQAHGVTVSRNTISAVIKRGELSVVRRDNGRGGISLRIVSDPLRDLVCPDTWIGKTTSIFSESYRKRRWKQRHRLEWGDVYRLVFALTSYAAEPMRSPRLLTLPLDMRKDLASATNWSTRGIYIQQMTSVDWCAPIETDQEMEKAVQWTRNLPHERPCSDKWRIDGIRELLKILKSSSHQQREMNLRMLKVFQAWTANGGFAKIAICKRMRISPYQLQYHLRTNQLMRCCYMLLMRDTPSSITEKDAYAQELHFRNARQPALQRTSQPKEKNKDSK